MPTGSGDYELYELRENVQWMMNSEHFTYFETWGEFVYHYPRTILHSFLFVIFFFMQKSCGQFVNVSDLYYVVCYLIKHAVSEWRLAQLALALALAQPVDIELFL